MASTETTIERDYTDNFTMKSMAMNTLVPKYFPNIDVSKLNIGEIGYVTELISNVMEDGFRTASTLINEAWVNRAQIPENIYASAAYFQLDANFASSAKALFIIMIPEAEVLSNATISGNIREFTLDKDTQFLVENKVFTLDYDIVITMKKIQGAWVYGAQYDTSYTNSISDIDSKYIKIRKNTDGYLYIVTYLHQVVREYTIENIINDNKIVLPSIDIPFSDQLAGFDVFYTLPGTTNRITLEKQMMFTSPVKTPFCFYKFKDDNTISISFATKEAYFQPVFNSTIEVVAYTTTGSAGNFSEYVGTAIAVTTTDTNFSYNTNVVISASTYGRSYGGADSKDIDTLRSLTIEAFSTSNAITT